MWGERLCKGLLKTSLDKLNIKIAVLFPSWNQCLALSYQIRKHRFDGWYAAVYDLDCKGRREQITGTAMVALVPPGRLDGMELYGKMMANRIIGWDEIQRVLIRLLTMFWSEHAIS